MRLEKLGPVGPNGNRQFPRVASDSLLSQVPEASPIYAFPVFCACRESHAYWLASARICGRGAEPRFPSPDGPFFASSFHLAVILHRTMTNWGRKSHAVSWKAAGVHCARLKFP